MADYQQNDPYRTYFQEVDPKTELAISASGLSYLAVFHMYAEQARREETMDSWLASHFRTDFAGFVVDSSGIQCTVEPFPQKQRAQQEMAQFILASRLAA